MLQPFDFAQLALPAACIFAFVLAVAAWATRSAAASLALAAVKTAVYLGYFIWVFDGSFNFLDDLTYIERARSLRVDGVGWLNLADSVPLLLAAGEGNHFLYYLVNVTAIRWFGDGYYAPVAVNVMAAALAAGLAAGLLRREALVAPRQAPWFFAFMLLHPDILVWSTFLNGKDTLVLLLHVVLLVAVSQYLRGQRLQALLLGAAAALALTFLRFYVPLLFAIALALASLRGVSGAARWRLVLAGVAGVVALVGTMGLDALRFWFDLLRADLVNPLFGFAKFLLTPIPFNTEAAYAFLDVPALLHWMLLPLAVVGFVQIRRTGTPFARILIAYIAVFAVLYTLYGELQGPRHRLQLDFAWATCQFLGLAWLLSGRTGAQLARFLAAAPWRASPQAHRNLVQP